MNLRIVSPLVLSCVMLATAHAAAAQAGQEAPPGTATVTGRVLVAGTNEGLDGARVSLSIPRQPSGTSTMTDDDGNFVLKSVPVPGGAPVQAMLLVSKLNYVPAEVSTTPATTAARRTIALISGRATSDVTIVMMRGGVIAGRVVDSRGRPVERTQVGVDIQRNGKWSFAASGQTDDLGEFRVAGLPSGTYVVLTSAPRTGGPDAEAHDTTAVETFYPSAATADVATLVPVTAGQTVSDLQITLLIGDAFAIFGVVTDGGGHPLANSHVSLIHTPGSSGLLGGGSSVATTDATGAFVLRNVPSGSYEIRATLPPPRPVATGTVAAAGAVSGTSSSTMTSSGGTTTTTTSGGVSISATQDRQTIVVDHANVSGVVVVLKIR